ncbi:hypothetical protein GCM10027418_09210 [Mariniluteicoccus endophyticus]
MTLAGARRDGTDPLVLADMLMYDAKEGGRNRFALHDPTCGSRPRMGQRLTMQCRLEDALDTEVIRGGTAPARAVRRPVARLRPRRQRLRAVGQQPGFRVAPVRPPRRAPPAPGRFVLELTETMVVADMDQARALATCLLRRGVDIALDDFGSGAASFDYLKQLPFSHIKIDGQFITDIVSSPVDRAIVRSLVGVARELDKTTMAEHIVDRAALEVVRDLGVDFGQGYGIGRPVPYDEFVRLHLGG